MPGALAGRRVRGVDPVGRPQATVVQVEGRPPDDGPAQHRRDLAQRVRVVDVHQQVGHLGDEPEAAPLAPLGLDERRLLGVVRRSAP